MRRWVLRAAGAAVLAVALDIVLSIFDFAPDHVRLALLVALGVAVMGLVSDSVGQPGAVWRVEPMGRGGVIATDRHLASYVRILESHLTARTADTALRARLAALCDERLSRRHGLTRDDPGAEALLGPELLHELAGPPRRLRREEIYRYLRRIEDL